MKGVECYLESVAVLHACDQKVCQDVFIMNTIETTEHARMHARTMIPVTTIASMATLSGFDWTVLSSVISTLRFVHISLPE